MQTLEELKALEIATNVEWYDANLALGEKIRKEKEEANQRIEAKNEDETKRVGNLYSAFLAARRAREEAEVELAKQVAMTLKSGVVLKAGDRVTRSKKATYHHYSDITLRGVVEVATHDSRFPANLRYAMPRVGSLFVRLLTKDGQPGKAFEKLETYSDWKLEATHE